MHWVEVGGRRMPRCVGGHPALDFCNTWTGWHEPPERRGDWLSDYDAFALWSAHAGLLPADEAARLRDRAAGDPARGADQLAEARQLRSALYEVLLGRAGAADVATVADHAERAAAARVLVVRPESESDGPALARWRLRDPGTLELPLLAVADSAAALLTHRDSAAVRACPGHGCGWLFLDLRNRRRWCSMASCGNRAKVRAHAQRRRNGGQ